MMRCKEYVFKLTSGQLEEGAWPDRFWAPNWLTCC